MKWVLSGRVLDDGEVLDAVETSWGEILRRLA